MTEQNYDSKADTLEHIRLVNAYLISAATELLNRAAIHDKSKLEDSEKELFDKYTPMLKELTYGSEKYKKCLADLKPALTHHYANNSHHPEHYANGISGFDLFDLIEMWFDWCAASKRHADGDIYKSIKINTERFNLSPQIVDILTNTANRFIH